MFIRMEKHATENTPYRRTHSVVHVIPLDDRHDHVWSTHEQLSKKLHAIHFG
jgi:hypothetical protein